MNRPSPIAPMPGKATNRQYELQGWNAKQGGFKLSDCPYYPSSAAEKYWVRGFNS